MENIKALVVDDEKVVRDFLVQLLVLRGVEAKAVEDGIKAINIMKQEKFDLVFLDVVMPGIDGLDTLRELKKIDADASYVMITGYPVNNILRKAEQEGALTSLKKPFEISYIVAIINNFHRKKPEKTINILVVDDDKIVRDFFRMLFKYRKYNAVIVETGKQAMEEIDSKEYDVAFIDIILADVDGAKLAEEIKKIKPNLNVVVMSGHPDRLQAIEDSQTFAALSKPFQIERIFNEIDKVRESGKGRKYG